MKPEPTRRPHIQTVFISQATAKELPSNPPGFGPWMLLSLLLWPVGLVGSVVYLSDPRYRGAGLALLGITLISAIATWLIFSAH